MSDEEGDVKDTSDLTLSPSQHFFCSKIVGGLTMYEKKNLVISPFSIYFVLQLLLCGLKEKTRDQLAEYLGVKEKSEEELGKNIVDLLKELKSEEIKLAFGIFADNSVKLKKEFVSTGKEKFQSMVKALKFPKEAVKFINDWVSKMTNNIFKKVVSNSSLKNANLVLINTVYFKAEWENKFKFKDTRDKPFNSFGKKKKVSMMTVDGRRNFYGKHEIGEFSFFSCRLPYKGKKFSMIFVLPDNENSVKGFKEFESAILDVSMKESIVTKMKKEQGFVELEKLGVPRFKTEMDIDLSEVVKKDVPLIFSGGNFGGLSDSKRVEVKKIIHKTFIRIDEEGTEAAAATVIYMLEGCCIRPPRPKFILNRPFFFFLIEESTDSVLFFGKVVSPKTDVKKRKRVVK